MKSNSVFTLALLVSALALAGAEFEGCDQHLSVTTVPEAYEAGLNLVRSRVGTEAQGCGRLYPMPAAPLDLGDLSMDRVAQEAANERASCRMGYVAASYGLRLRLDGQDAGLCQLSVDHAVTEAMPWLALSADQHQLNTRTCERAYHGNL